MMFNKAAKRLLEFLGPLDVVLHDWWMYRLISAAGGAIRYDPQPILKYREHPHNLIGSNLGQGARLVRIGMLLSGRFRNWNTTNVAALQRVPPHLIEPLNRATFELFSRARAGSLLHRLKYLQRSGVYRQTWLGNIGLYAGAIIARI